MRKLPFVLWILGWPVAYELTSYLHMLDSGKPPTPMTGAAGWFFLTVWAVVAVFAYDGRE
jgi:hypothetical protein